MIDQKPRASSLSVAIANAKQAFGIGLLRVEDEQLYFLAQSNPVMRSKGRDYTRLSMKLDL